MKKLLFSLLILISFPALACICVPLIPVSKDIFGKYDVIFHGTVDSIGTCDEKERSVAYFTVTELYKGKTERHVKVYFDCVSECLMSLAVGEEWIIYTRYLRFDHLEVLLCEHSRKKAAAGLQDAYEMDSKRTFEQELKFLDENLGLQPFVQPVVLNNNIVDSGRHNEQPGSWGKVILLLISLAVMAVVYVFTRRKK